MQTERPELLLIQNKCIFDGSRLLVVLTAFHAVLMSIECRAIYTLSLEHI